MDYKIIFVILVVIQNCLGQRESTSSVENRWDKRLEYKLNLMKQSSNTNFTLLKNEIQQIKDMKTSESTDCPKDWIPFSDTKCLKVLPKKESLYEAKNSCLTLDSDLLSIHSEDENEFVVKLVTNYTNIADSVLLGMELADRGYVWSDGSGQVEFNKFSELENSNEQQAIRPGCAKLSMHTSNTGEWSEELCRKKLLVVCQKKQTSKTVLMQELKDLRTDFTDLINYLSEEFQNKDKDKDTNKPDPLPIGFIYTQLPRQQSPQELWPLMKWEDVTSEYAGLFFRAEGGDSKQFGEVQDDNTRRLTSVKSHSDGFDESNKKVEIVAGTRSPRIYTGAAFSGYVTTNWALSFKVSDDEVRPKNTAIRMWKRVGEEEVFGNVTNYVNDNLVEDEKVDEDVESDEPEEVVTRNSNRVNKQMYTRTYTYFYKNKK